MVVLPGIGGPYPVSLGLSLTSLTFHVLAIVCCKAGAFPFTAFGVSLNRPGVEHGHNALSTIY